MALKAADTHGGNIHAVAMELGRRASSLLDFSASINPLGPSSKVRRLLAREAEGLIRHYPDPECGNLRRALASRWRLSPRHFVIGNGSIELIHLLPRVLQCRSALIVGPTFSEYGAALSLAGAQAQLLSARKRDGYRPPLDKAGKWIQSAARRAQGASAVFLCNPNSPTGQACEPGDLEELVRQAGQSGVWMILDETFMEYCESLSLLPVLHRYPRLIVLRSFTKFYGLPGLRIGYGVCAPSLAEVLRRHQPPWSVNGYAQAAAETAMNDRPYVRRSLAFMEAERERVSMRLSGIPGLRVFPSRANFLLLELPDLHQASGVAAVLRQQGLLVRDCSRVPGLTTRSIRVAIRTEPENDRMVVALRRLLGTGRDR